jgi:DNA-binding MarR family transcriptional regulator
MTGKLDRLEAQGLIQRIPDPEDRRVIRLRVTDSGRSTIDEAFRSSLEVYDSILDDLSPAEREQLATLLTKLLKRLDHLAESK